MTKYTDFLTKSFGRITLTATDFGLSQVIFPDMTQGESERAKLAMSCALDSSTLLLDRACFVRWTHQLLNSKLALMSTRHKQTSTRHTNMDAQREIDVLNSLTLGNQNEDERFKSVIEILLRYFAGEHMEFTDIPIDLSNCCTFQRDVLNITRQIPYGEVRTYKWIAEYLGKTRSLVTSATASRQVGQSLARNPVTIIIPCHRVIGSNGSLTGYRLGLSMKRQLLTMEGSL